MKTSLIVGMGIGNLYADILTKMGHGIITVDANPDKKANFLSVEDAIKECRLFDTAHICTPNFTHLPLATTLAKCSDIVFVEKPGVATSDDWAMLVNGNLKTRFMMVKNNMWRDNIQELQQKANEAKNVEIDWIRKNCIPSPGSWFTTRGLAFGGVSRDLMPHLLSLYIALNPNWRAEPINGQASLQNWLLEDIESTEYGIVYPDGTYNVDDQCNIHFSNKWDLRANWRSMDIERSAITFINQDNSRDMFELGWCPEEAYLNMITDAVNNRHNDEFWNNQLEIDLWIHERIENL